MAVPFVDLRAQHDELRAELEHAIRTAIEESAFIGGHRVTDFETAFAQFCGARHCVSVASGTDALELGLRAMGIGPGDVVLTVPNTFIATAEAAVQLGAVPRFVDVDPRTYNMDPALAERYLVERCERDARGTLRERESGLRVAALLPVHLYGLMADMAPLLELARSYGLQLLEDACQAHGASYRLADGRWAGAGTLGRAGAFSFYPGKNLGAMGEAGALVTDDDALAERVRVLRDHGQREKYLSITSEGVNARMDALQAEVLRLKLARLADWNAQRRQAATWYAEELADTELGLPFEPEGFHHVYHLYEVRVPNRDDVQRFLHERGIATGLHYPIPLHLQPAFAERAEGPGSYPAAERAAQELLSVPMHPHLTRAQVAEVAASLKQALASQ